MATLTACPKCRTVVPPGQPACLRCGHAVTTAVRACPACDRRNDETARFCAYCGHSLALPAEPPLAAPVDLPSAPTTPVSAAGILVDYQPRLRRLPLLVCLAVLAALVVFLTSIKIVQHYVFQPGPTVVSYFDALRDRDADAARKLLVPTSGEYAQTLLQRAVLTSAGYTPPADVRIEQTDYTGDQATVRVSFSVDGQRHTLFLDLRRDEHATVGLFYRWRIAGGVYPLTVSAPGIDSVLVAGAPVPLSVNGSATELPAFPGGYRVTLPDQPLWEAAPVVGYAGVSNPATATLDPTVKTGAQAAVATQVRAYLDACATSTTLDPAGCGFSGYSYEEVRDVQWTIVKYPEFTVTRDYNGRAVVTTTSDGEADVTGQVVSSFDGSTYPLDQRTTFSITGTVTVSDAGDIVFQAQEA